MRSRSYAGARSLLAAVFMAACSGVPTEGTGAPASDTGPCNDDTRYIPQGVVVSVPGDCPPYPESCPYRCEAPVCGGAPDAVTCEPCEALNLFNSYDGQSGCVWFRIDGGAFSHACD